MVNDAPSNKDSVTRDLILVNRAVQGDQKAFAGLMAFYEDSLYHMLLKKVNDPVVAEDLTIESFSKAFHKIANNHCIDYLRKQKKDPCARDKNQSPALQPDIVDQSFGPEESFIRDQRQRLMRDVVDKLNPRYRQLIKLRFFEELSYEEIATQLKMPIGTVKAGIFRAKDLLYLILRNSKEI
jgi:RNA polymerase sigma-70 factor (ECF subfamily)